MLLRPAFDTGFEVVCFFFFFYFGGGGGVCVVLVFPFFFFYCFFPLWISFFLSQSGGCRGIEAYYHLTIREFLFCSLDQNNLIR